MTLPFSVDELDIIHYVDELQDQVLSIGNLLKHLRSRYHYEKRSAAAKKGWATRRNRIWSHQRIQKYKHFRDQQQAAEVKGAQAP